MANDEVRPALSAEEWREWTETPFGGLDYFWDVKGQRPHATAALALNGRPFGFTREDVRELRSYGGSGYVRPALESIAARIEALLPPEGQ